MFTHVLAAAAEDVAGIAVDTDGEVFVAATAGTSTWVVKLDGAGALDTAFGGGAVDTAIPCAPAHSMTVDAAGDVWVVNLESGDGDCTGSDYRKLDGATGASLLAADADWLPELRPRHRVRPRRWRGPARHGRGRDRDHGHEADRRRGGRLGLRRRRLGAGLRPVGAPLVPRSRRAPRTGRWVDHRRLPPGRRPGGRNVRAGRVGVLHRSRHRGRPGVFLRRTGGDIRDGRDVPGRREHRRRQQPRRDPGHQHRRHRRGPRLRRLQRAGGRTPRPRVGARRHHRSSRHRVQGNGHRAPQLRRGRCPSRLRPAGDPRRCLQPDAGSFPPRQRHRHLRRPGHHPARHRG